MQSYDLESKGSISLVSPSPSLLGSRKNSMTSISSIASSSTSTLGESRTGTWSSRTSSICASLTDGSPLRQENSLNSGEMSYCNGNLITHQREQHAMQGGNINTSMIPSHDSVDFRSLQFQIDNQITRKETVAPNGIRPGSSQSFTAATSGRPTSKGKDKLISKVEEVSKNSRL